MTAPPEWLERYQAQFSAMLRAQLDRSTGTLRARPNDYPVELCAGALAAGGRSGAERLAVYNRQYWFRLFTVLQTEHRLTAALLGAWPFNELAARYLAEQPPRHPDLARAADGFTCFLERATPEEGGAVPRRAILQAARIDDAYRDVFRAPAQAPFSPSAADRERLSQARLRWSLAVRRIEEDWPLLALRAEVQAVGHAVPLPLPHPEPRQAMICRSPQGYRVVPLEPLEAELMRLLETLPLSDALAELEKSAPPAAHASLPARAQRWLAQGMQLGFWTGLSL